MTAPLQTLDQPETALVRQFFAEHPEHCEGVQRANLAYHANHRDAGAHYFAGSWREALPTNKMSHGATLSACESRTNVPAPLALAHGSTSGRNLSENISEIKLAHTEKISDSRESKGQ